MSATALKIIAVFCMTLDHMAVYLDAPLFLRYPGRFAAVIFFFCAAESTVRTHDRRKYLLRLYQMSLLMAGLSVAVPFVLGGWFTSQQFFPPESNIFTALVPGVWLISILEDTKNAPAARKRRLLRYTLWQLASVPVWFILEIFITEPLHLPDGLLPAAMGSVFLSEGGLWLAVQIPLFYFLRGDRKKLAAGFLAYCAVYTAVFLPQIPGRMFWFVNAHFPRYSELINNCLGMFGLSAMEQVIPLKESLLEVHFQCFMVLALPLLLAYNGERGKGMKKFFYIYYPAHIYALWLIQHILNP